MKARRIASLCKPFRPKSDSASQVRKKMSPLQRHLSLIARNLSTASAPRKGAGDKIVHVVSDGNEVPIDVKPTRSVRPPIRAFRAEPSHRQASRLSSALMRKIICRLDSRYVGVSLLRRAAIPCQAYLRKSVISARTTIWGVTAERMAPSANYVTT
jgi:hypothetical protein